MIHHQDIPQFMMYIQVQFQITVIMVSMLLIFKKDLQVQI